MAKQKTINFKSIFEEIDFNGTASPARISSKTADKIISFRERHAQRGNMTLSAYNQ